MFLNSLYCYELFQINKNIKNLPNNKLYTCDFNVLLHYFSQVFFPRSLVFKKHFFFKTKENIF